MKNLTLAALLASCAITACAPAPVPIERYDVPYTGKWDPLSSAPETSPRPVPRPQIGSALRIKIVDPLTIACPKAWRPEEGCNDARRDDGRPVSPADVGDTPVAGGSVPVGGPDRPVDPSVPDGPGPDTPATVTPEPEPEPPTTPPGNPGHGGDKPAGQNPGNNKPVGNAPFDGERGEEPSGRGKDKGRGPA
jgi:hypothetical protein